MKALILVDFENEWIDPKSEYFVGDISEVINSTNRLISWARINQLKLIFTIHEEVGSEGAFIPNSFNTQLIEKLNISNSDIVIKKNKISPFYKTDLEKELQGIGSILVGGILTNLCVRSLVADAYDRNFSITVVKDCCASLDDKTQEFTFKDLKTTRPEVEFIYSRDIIR
jgi:ureidoacrylate peracid hydrolase